MFETWLTMQRLTLVHAIVVYIQTRSIWKLYYIFSRLFQPETSDLQLTSHSDIFLAEIEAKLVFFSSFS